MCLCVCVCSREKETEGERGSHKTGDREAERGARSHRVQLYTWTALSIYTVLHSPTPYCVYSYTLSLHCLYTLHYIHWLNTAIPSLCNNIYILYYIHSHRILYSYTLTLHCLYTLHCIHSHRILYTPTTYSYTLKLHCLHTPTPHYW